MQIKTAKGLALQDILTEVHAYIHRGTVYINIYVCVHFVCGL